MILKSDSQIPKSFYFIYFIESHLKMMKNALKSSFGSQEI